MVEMCDWCLLEKAQGSVILRSFHTYTDTSFRIGWDCRAKLNKLMRGCASGHEIPKVDEEQEEDDQRRAIEEQQQ